MCSKLNIWLLLFLSCNTNLFSQDVNYTFKNYTLKDGLAGNNVYCATQDKEGFIWFGTETGLSRFDGSHFKNYTVANGLPDNEIINIFTDGKGRIWLIPFKKSICYIINKKVHNSTNDSVLKKIKIIGNCYNITEDNSHRIIIHDTKAIHIVEENGFVRTLDANLFGDATQFVNIYRTVTGNVYVLSKRDIYKLEQNNLRKIFTLKKENNDPFFTTMQIVTDSSVFVQNSNILFPFPSFKIAEHFFYSERIKFHNGKRPSALFDKIGEQFYQTTITGINYFNINKSDSINTVTINKQVNRAFIDAENNSYLLSRNAGIYVKNNEAIKLKLFSDNFSKDLGIEYINGNRNNLFLGATNNNPIVINKNNLNISEYFSKYNCLFDKFGSSTSPICFLNENGNKENIIANSNGIFLKNENSFKPILQKNAIKHIEEIGDNFLIGTIEKLLLLDKKNYKIIDTIWNERTTSANFINNNYYIGTINGLYKLTLDKKSFYLGDSFPIFQRRISSIKKGPDNTIWVGTYDAGVAACKDGKVLQIFNDSNGLTSNICRNLFVNGNYLWVGTDKGLNKIDISKPPYKIVINYTTTDGLASNMINAVYADSNMVYVGTPEGLTYFDESKIVNDSKCDMRILGITISGKEQQWDSTKITLKHRDNNIRFDFVGLSFKSAGDISYTYRLIGLDGEEWKTTRENYLDYPTLPSGNYTFEIQATNKFGVKSSIVKINFEIEKTITERWWFRLLLLLCCIFLLFYIYKNSINKVKERAKEKQHVANKLNEMEQMALKSQMNPHFIFNCLNSIQDYVINSDVQGANKFITDFSRLIRSTLDNSSKKTISIADEIQYLTNYMIVEQYRFENKFTYNIFIDEVINTNDNFIPPMLLQPYIENAIRHGINNKKEGVGLIQINILKEQNNLLCQIIDNGIGRKAAMLLKGNNAIEYQSKGMELTAKRIQLLNKNIGEDIVIKIEDVEVPEMGTKVSLTIPIN